MGWGATSPALGHGHAQPVGGGRGQADEHHRAGPELEGQQLDAEQGGGHRGAEHRAHPGRGAGHQQARRWAAVRWNSWPTIEPTAPPVRMIGPSAPNGPAGADADGTGDGFQHGQAGLDPAAVDQDPLHGLGDAVPADLLGAEAGHQPHDQAAADRDDDGERAQRVAVRGDQVHAEALVVEEVGEEPDHVQQGQGDPRPQRADDDGQGHEPQERAGGGEITEDRSASARRHWAANRGVSPTGLRSSLWPVRSAASRARLRSGSSSRSGCSAPSGWFMATHPSPFAGLDGRRGASRGGYTSCHDVTVAL